MTRRRKTLLVVIVLLLLAGGFAWYWQATGWGCCRGLMLLGTA